MSLSSDDYTFPSHKLMGFCSLHDYLSTYVQHTVTRLEDALAARFTDADEIKDVANYGCSGGVSGFIYSSELFDFFSKYESEIEDVLNLCDVKLEHLVRDPDEWTFQEMREAAVWFVVEDYCQRQVLEAEAEHHYAIA